MSEVQWLAPERKDYFRFVKALPHLKTIYGQLEFGFFDGMDDGVNIVSKTVANGYEVSAGVLDQPALVHSYDGAAMLTDGLKGPQDFRSGYWLGFEEKDVVATIDMGEQVEISSLNYSVCVYTQLWLFDAVSAEISASQDGEEYATVASETYPEYTGHHYEIAEHELTFSPVRARYFRVKIECPKVLPQYHNGRSHALYLFVDEIALD